MEEAGRGKEERRRGKEETGQIEKLDGCSSSFLPGSQERVEISRAAHEHFGLLGQEAHSYPR